MGQSLPDNSSHFRLIKPVRLFLTMALIGLILVIASLLALQWVTHTLKQANHFNQIIFVIKKGDTLNAFVQQLQQVGVIDEPYSLSLYARYKGLAGQVHTGNYQFEDGLSLIEVLDAITTGKYRMTYNFTFVQGSTFRQLRDLLSNNKDIKQTLVNKSDADLLALYDPLLKYSHPEGLFFPETYLYYPGETDKELLERAFDMMQTTLTELWRQRADNLEISTPYEALVLASIIEKETALPSERAQISGVFMNRLKIGMRLQTDPTVIYGLGDDFDGNLTRRHLNTDTPYNTYTRTGLPPTPISLPGRAAIKAALHPDKTKALYFVAKGDGSGGHQFSTTLDQHNKAVRQYLKTLRRSSSK